MNKPSVDASSDESGSEERREPKRCHPVILINNIYDGNNSFRFYSKITMFRPSHLHRSDMQQHHSPQHQRRQQQELRYSVDPNVFEVNEQLPQFNQHQYESFSLHRYSDRNTGFISKMDTKNSYRKNT